MDLFALLGVVVVNADLTKWISLVLSGGGVASPVSQRIRSPWKSNMLAISILPYRIWSEVYNAAIGFLLLTSQSEFMRTRHRYYWSTNTISVPSRRPPDQCFDWDSIADLLLARVTSIQFHARTNVTAGCKRELRRPQNEQISSAVATHSRPAFFFFFFFFSMKILHNNNARIHQ